MAYGLQTFNAEGSIKLDTSARLIRTVSIMNISSPAYGPSSMFLFPSGTASNFVATGYFIDNTGKKSPLAVTNLSTGFYIWAYANYAYEAVVTITGY